MLKGDDPVINNSIDQNGPDGCSFITGGGPSHCFFEFLQIFLALVEFGELRSQLQKVLNAFKEDRIIYLHSITLLGSIVFDRYSQVEQLTFKSFERTGGHLATYDSFDPV